MYFVTLFLLFCVVKTINHRMKCHKPFYALLATTSPLQTNSKTTPSISRSNYSPLSSENHRSLFVKPAKRGRQRAGVRLCLPQIISPLILNHVALIIVSSRNSVRVVFLIARGWRGTSLPRVSIHKEIQRRRC